jgi:hypothetical protein
MSARASSARIVEDLVDYDGPQLLLLKTDRNRHMLAIAIKRDGLSEPFWGCEIRDKTYDGYFAQKLDLHFAFTHPFGNTYYFFDLALAENYAVKLVTAQPREADNPAYWPKVGFFARSHTNPFNLSRVVAATRSFKIDGKWAANDFSHFHGKMSDLYGLFGVLGRLQGAHSTTERAFIQQAIQTRFWQGGGSYLGFYDSLIDRNRLLRLAPLEVEKIQYASPGEIVLRGNNRALSDVSDIIDVLDERGDALARSYRGIYRVLRKEELLSARPSTPFSSAATQKLVLKLTREFAEQMQLERIDQIFEACDDNTLVFAKVMLSIFRRAKEVYMFHAEGRVQRM